MREFKLINKRGEEFNLMRKDAYFNSPAGLGFTINQETVQIGNEFITVSSQYNQPVLSGEMVFRGYKVYREFIQFLTEKLRVAYKPLKQWYYADCEVLVVAKGEIDATSKRLLCGIDIGFHSQWYLPAKFEQTQPGEDGGKVYTYTYPYTYIGGEPGIIQIANASTENAPCRLYIMGACVNPRWEVIQGGKVVARGQVNATIQEGRKLFISSLASELQISELSLDNTFIQDLYQASDFSTGRFIYLPPGEASLTVSDESGTQMVAYVEVLQFAATV